MGMHNSRKLQLEQATLMVCGFMRKVPIKVAFQYEIGLEWSHHTDWT
jgi:hypothetical protein